MADARIYDPSPRRLRRARDEGQVLLAPTLIGAGACTAAMIAMPWAAHRFVTDWTELAGLVFAIESVQPADAIERAQWIGLRTFAQIALPALVAALLIGFATVRPFAMLRAPQARFARLDPLAGLRGLVSPWTLTHRVAALSLGAGAIVVAAWTLESAAPAVLGRTDLTAPYLMRASSALLSAAGWWMCALLWFAGGIGYVIARSRWWSELKMTRAEAQRESRETHGDPNARRARQARHRALTGHVDRTIVWVWVRGDHVAVAVHWGGGDSSPAVGRTVLARALASEEIPVIADQALATSLARQAPGTPIPRHLFHPLAAAAGRYPR